MGNSKSKRDKKLFKEFNLNYRQFYDDSKKLFDMYEKSYICDVDDSSWNNYKKYLEYFKNTYKKYYDNALGFEKLRKQGEYGNPIIQHVICHSSFVNKNIDNIEYWLLKLYEQNNVKSALYALGTLFLTNKNWVKAFKYLEMYVSKYNEPTSKFRLGRLYLHGWGTEQNCKKAFELFVKANNPESQLIIGVMYRNGQYVAKDDAKALEWFTKSANTGYYPAKKQIAIMTNDKDFLEKDEMKTRIEKLEKHFEAVKLKDKLMHSAYNIIANRPTVIV